MSIDTLKNVQPDLLDNVYYEVFLNVEILLLILCEFYLIH